MSTASSKYCINCYYCGENFVCQHDEAILYKTEPRIDVITGDTYGFHSIKRNSCEDMRHSYMSGLCTGGRLFVHKDTDPYTIKNKSFLTKIKSFFRKD